MPLGKIWEDAPERIAPTIYYKKRNHCAATMLRIDEYDQDHYLKLNNMYMDECRHCAVARIIPSLEFLAACLMSRSVKGCRWSMGAGGP